MSCVKKVLIEGDVDSELLAVCEEEDLKAISPQGWNLKKKLLLMKALKFLQGI